MGEVGGGRREGFEEKPKGDDYGKFVRHKKEEKVTNVRGEGGEGVDRAQGSEAFSGHSQSGHVNELRLGHASRESPCDVVDRTCRG